MKWGDGSAGTVSQIPISGDGTGGFITVNIQDKKVTAVTGVIGGSGYTHGRVRFITETYVDDNNEDSQ